MGWTVDSVRSSRPWRYRFRGKVLTRAFTGTSGLCGRIRSGLVDWHVASQQVVDQQRLDLVDLHFQPIYSAVCAVHPVVRLAKTLRSGGLKPVQVPSDPGQFPVLLVLC